MVLLYFIKYCLFIIFISVHTAIVFYNSNKCAGGMSCMLLCPWGSGFKSASDLPIVEVCMLEKGHLNHISSPTLLVFYDLCM